MHIGCARIGCTFIGRYFGSEQVQGGIGSASLPSFYRHRHPYPHLQPSPPRPALLPTFTFTLASGQVQGDISAAYPPSVDPAKMEAQRRMELVGAASKSSMLKGGAYSRFPFNEQWAQMRAPQEGTLYTLVPPAG